MNITVVGASVIGCAVAHELASRGARVRLLDPRGVGQGATRASAGILAPYIEGHASPLLELGVCSLALYDEFVRRVCASARTPVEYERSGTMQVALDGTEANALAAAAHALAEAGVAHTLLEGRDARRLEPALPEGTAAGLEIPVHGFVDAQALTSALAEAAVARGATLTETQVLGVGGDSSGARVATSDGTVSSDAVIVAAGSWSSALAGRPDQPIVKPIRGQLLRLGMDARPAARVLWSSRCYLVPRNDGTVLVGATVEDVGFDERPTSAGVLGLLDAAFELMPALRDASFDDVRTGLRPMAADELPIVGRASTMPHVFLATGHYRNGVLLAPLTASMLADLVLEGQERGELAMMRPSRFGA